MIFLDDVSWGGDFIFTSVQHKLCHAGGDSREPADHSFSWEEGGLVHVNAMGGLSHATSPPILR